MLTQQLFVDPRFVIKPLEIPFRYQFHEILVSLFILAEHDQMVRPAARRIPIQPIVFATYISQPMIGLTPAFFAAS